MTAIAEAQKTATRKDLSDDEQLLMAIAKAAWLKYPKTDVTQQSLRVENVRNRLGRSLWRHLFDREDTKLIDQQIRHLLADAVEEDEKTKPVSAPKQGADRSGGSGLVASGRDAQRASAASTEPPTPQRPSAIPPTPSLKAMADAQARAHEARNRAWWETSPFYDVRINGRPIFVCSATELRNRVKELNPAIKENMLISRFLTHLSSGLAGGEIIGQVWREDEVRTFYEQAQHEAAEGCAVAGIAA